MSMTDAEVLEEIREVAERFADIIKECERAAPNAERLKVMRQNPADNHHWSKSCGALKLSDLRIALSNINGFLRAIEALGPVKTNRMEGD